jgi:Na+/proline symporter
VSGLFFRGLRRGNKPHGDRYGCPHIESSGGLFRCLAYCVLASLEIGLIVGSYVWLIFGAPSSIFNVGIPIDWPFWAASIVSITVSSLVAIAVLGYALLSILSRKSTVLSLKSRGLKVISSSQGCHMNLSSFVSPMISSNPSPSVQNLIEGRM